LQALPLSFLPAEGVGDPPQEMRQDLPHSISSKSNCMSDPRCLRDHKRAKMLLRARSTLSLLPR
jgi:hypothetical protein